MDRNTNGESSTIFETFCTIKKPAKKCRIFLASSRIQDLDKLTTTCTFFRLVGLEYTGNKNYEVNVSWWNFFFLPNRIRTFAFKFYNNILGLNTRTAHFIINPNRNCTFCSLRDGSAVDESFLHLFFQCPTTTGKTSLRGKNSTVLLRTKMTVKNCGFWVPYPDPRNRTLHSLLRYLFFSIVVGRKN